MPKDNEPVGRIGGEVGLEPDELWAARIPAGDLRAEADEMNVSMGKWAHAGSMQ